MRSCFIELVQPAVERYNDTKVEEKERFKIEYSFRKSPSLKQLLTLKKSENSLGVSKCLGGCKLCNENIHTGRTLTLKTGAKLTANARFECTSRNVVYVMICLGCKEFYVGETGDTLRNRFSVQSNKWRWNRRTHQFRSIHIYGPAVGGGAIKCSHFPGPII